MRRFLLIAALFSGVGVAAADSLNTYESFAEGFLGTSFSDAGVTYRDANLESGVFPDGATFTSDDLGSEFIIENAALFFNDFPAYGSPVNVLTFGRAFVPGDNLSIGVCSSIWMDLAEPASAASLDIAYYENGPWGGIVYHLDAIQAGTVVATDSFTLANGGGRDNPSFSTLSVSAAEFDTLHLYATFGAEFSAPRGMIDNLALTSATPPCPGDLNGDGQVDLSDLATLLSNFGTPSGAGADQGDLDADGDVDLSDLAALLGNFGTIC
ncbi:MAG: hypothetical protein IT450_17805 [Phycisphaerales bacterium]|nr:hypothetical protein [Phycisphaerales bacterium]